MVCWGQKWHYAPLIIKLTKVQAERSPMSWIDDLIFYLLKSVGWSVRSEIIRNSFKIQFPPTGFHDYQYTPRKSALICDQVRPEHIPPLLL
ncbi:hypothetical protein BW014_23625 [Salmonella enterica]|nr:hypothetical protein [Salmonella enterica]EBW8395862.1 hypothetical protein [Salmonella enterica subsp. enterica serovar Florida]EBG9726424.1 hypothetical protein [Salmonella enterica]ECD7243783.1 hypothetical protein [Salmonella enterica subsp. enterica serovar Florida]ECF4168228.1 hypothetical protein [Salmonella enterica subsp. enterica serovar Florida]